MTKRTEGLRERLEAAGCDAFFSLAPAANQYLTGFRGSTSGVLVTLTDAWFFCDFRYTEQAGQEIQGFEVAEVTGSLPTRLGERLATTGAKRAAYDPGGLTVSQLEAVRKEYAGAVEPLPEAVAALRRVKSEEEIDSIRRASELAEGVLTDLVASLEPGLPERELAARFEYEFRKRGASGAAFDTIALFGSRSSLPHGEPGDTRLEGGHVVLLDLGCRLDGYCSDLTRTYAFDTMPGAWFEEVYGLTLKAQCAALESVRPGISCGEVDAVARDIIREAGYGEQFGHGLGHGVGIEVHEGPRLNAESETVLQAGMVITIEPGIYLPGRGGVRIEDLVVVTETGGRPLTTTTKELKVIAP